MYHSTVVAVTDLNFIELAKEIKLFVGLQAMEQKTIEILFIWPSIYLQISLMKKGKLRFNIY